MTDATNSLYLFILAEIEIRRYKINRSFRKHGSHQPRPYIHGICSSIRYCKDPSGIDNGVNPSPRRHYTAIYWVKWYRVSGLASWLLHKGKAVSSPSRRGHESIYTTTPTYYYVQTSLIHTILMNFLTILGVLPVPFIRISDDAGRSHVWLISQTTQALTNHNTQQSTPISPNLYHRSYTEHKITIFTNNVTRDGAILRLATANGRQPTRSGLKFPSSLWKHRQLNSKLQLSTPHRPRNGFSTKRPRYQRRRLLNALPRRLCTHTISSNEKDLGVKRRLLFCSGEIMYN